MVMIIGLFDLTVASVIGTTIARESQFLPRNESQCPIADSWKVPDDGGKGLFEVIGDSGPVIIPNWKAICHDFRSNRYYGIGVV